MLELQSSCCVGEMATGAGFNHLKKSIGIPGAPVMSNQSFIIAEQTIAKWWWNIFNESMLAARKTNNS